MKKLKKLLKDNQLTIAVAESLTSGKLQDRLCNQSGASSFYKGGVTAYSLESKVNILGVGKKHAEDVNCVSEKLAKEMSKGVSELFNSSIGIATTGYADSDVVNGVHVPYAHIAIYFNGEYHNLRVAGKIEMTRTNVRKWVVDRTMELLEKVVVEFSKLPKKITRIDSLGLVPGSSVIKLKGKILNTEAKFIRHDPEAGYVFIDCYEEIFTMSEEDFDDTKVKFLRNE